MRPFLLLVLVTLISMAACTAAPPPTRGIAPPSPTAESVPSSFSVQYSTGSVPPPFNYNYALDGTFQQEALGIDYTLTYRYRDQITPGEIAAQGYTEHDDMHWAGEITGEMLKGWRQLLAETKLGPIPPLAPGADSFTVTLMPGGGAAQTGVPENREAWQSAIATLDKQARQATGAARPEP